MPLRAEQFTKGQANGDVIDEGPTYTSLRGSASVILK